MKSVLSLIIVSVCILSAVSGAYFLGVFGSQPPPNPTQPEYKPKPTGADAAAEWRLKAWRDENGDIPSNPIWSAIEARDTWLQGQEATDGFSNGAIARMNWVSRGPANVGGRTRSVVIHPTNTDIMWAASVSGGIWKSTDGGQSWFSGNGENGSLQSLAIGSLAIDPNNPDILYAGTGEGFFNGDAIYIGAGIFKSTDGGTSWTQLGATSRLGNVNAISVAPGNSNLILAATNGDGDSLTPGIIRSTNGGATWAPEASGSINTAFEVVFHPTNAGKAIAEIVQECSCPSVWKNTVLYTTDGGNNWSAADRGAGDFDVLGHPARIELAYSKSDPDVVYAFNPKSSYPYGEVSRSDDGGHTFSIKNTNGSAGFGVQMWYDNTIWVSPTNSDFVVIGAVSLYRSTNAGNDFTQISGAVPHADQHCVVEDPRFGSVVNGITNRRVLVCNDGGIYAADNITTANGSDGWESLNNGYQTGQYYGAAGDGETDLILGGLQDNGTLRLPAGSTNATSVLGADGGFSAVDPVNTGYCYGEIQYGILFRFSNECTTVTPNSIGPSDQASFIAPFVLDLNDTSGNRMFFGGNKLWRTSNARTGSPPTWTNISTRAANITINTISVAPGNSNIVWISEGFPSKIYKTNNALNASPSPSPTFTVVDDNGGTNPIPTNTYVPKILIDKDNSDIVYVSFGGFPEPSPSPGNLYRTVNGGSSWTDISANLPRVPIRAIARHPNDASKLYVGTEIGVYKSDKYRWFVASGVGRPGECLC